MPNAAKRSGVTRNSTETSSTTRHIHSKGNAGEKIQVMKSDIPIGILARVFVMIALTFVAVTPSHSYGNMTTVVNVTCGIGLHGSTIETCESLIREDQRVIKMLSSMKKEKEASASDQKRYSAEQLYLERDIANAQQVIDFIKAKGPARQ